MADQDQGELFRSAIAPPEPPPQEQPTPEVVEPPVSTPAPAETPPPTPEPSGIPAWRLKEEIEARREAEGRFRQLEEQLQRLQAAQPPQAPTKESFLENPDQAVMRILAQQLQPFVEHNHQQMMAMGRMVADTTYGADLVRKAEEAFMEARANQTLDPADYERVVQSPNRYAEAVRWFQTNSTVAAVGTDPEAWFAKQLESRLADPKFQTSLLEKMRAAKPGTVLPPSLSKVTAARGNGTDSGDVSDAALFAFAMGKKQ